MSAAASGQLCCRCDGGARPRSPCWNSSPTLARALARLRILDTERIQSLGRLQLWVFPSSKPSSACGSPLRELSFSKADLGYPGPADACSAAQRLRKHSMGGELLSLRRCDIDPGLSVRLITVYFRRKLPLVAMRRNPSPWRQTFAPRSPSLDDCTRARTVTDQDCCLLLSV